LERGPGGRLTAQGVVARSRAALNDRIVIERAKGVPACTDGVAPDRASQGTSASGGQ
jgi:hypothetical protein